MMAPPKSLLGLGATLLTLRLAQQLRRPGVARAQQERTRRDWLRASAQTSFGRQHGLHRRLKYSQWQERVPPRRYEQFAPYLQRMGSGEENVLWPGRCSLFAPTAGTTTGMARLVPVTPAMLSHFRRGMRAAILHYHARLKSGYLFRGRHLLLGASAEPAPLPDHGESIELTGLLAHLMPTWAAKNFYEPGWEIAQLPDWNERLTATLQRVRQRDLTLVAGQPNWLLALAQAAVASDQRKTAPAQSVQLQDLWPHLECIIHGGVPLAPYADQLRQVAGPGVTFHEVYAATEAFVAVQESESSAGLRLLTGLGVFYEFIPLADFETGKLDTLGTKALPVEGVQANQDYVVLVTTPAGLCRYVLGDVVRFVSTEPPRLIHVGRVGLQLNALHEGVHEKEVTDALTSVCQRHNWRIVNFHVAPYFGLQGARPTRGCHEWWIELRPGTMETPTGPAIAQELDRELRRLSPRYEARRLAGALEAPVARLVMPGVFEQWMRAAGKWGGQSKMPRCRSDRLVADELCVLAPYSAH
jgi:hypothetical protein